MLAHELAHIRRYDYLVNLVQTAIETLLFYHPAVWWVSRRIRADRNANRTTHCMVFRLSGGCVIFGEVPIATKPEGWSVRLRPSIPLPLFFSSSRVGRIHAISRWVLFLVLAGVTAIVWSRHRRRIRPGHCQKCGYNLTGNVSGLCPECGKKI
jgi:hypothetical protein